MSVPLEFNFPDGYSFFGAEGVLSGLYYNQQLAVHLQHFLKFAADRWVGIEGLMAVSAYPAKGWGLFYTALTEKLEIGSIDLYQEICLSQYRYTDLTKYQFGSIPGAVAFLFYSGAKWFLVVGMFLLILFVLFSESFIYRLSPYLLFTSCWVIIVANSSAQFGVAPRCTILTFFMFTISALFLYLVQKISIRQ